MKTLLAFYFIFLPSISFCVSTQTSGNLKLFKPGVNDPGWGVTTNIDWDIVDSSFTALQSSFTSLQTTGTLWNLSGTNVFLTTSTYSVGIGTASPSSKLTVFNGDIRISTNTGSRGIIFQDETTQRTAASNVTLGTGTANFFPIYISSLAVGDSSLSQDSAGLIRIGGPNAVNKSLLFQGDTGGTIKLDQSVNRWDFNAFGGSWQAGITTNRVDFRSILATSGFDFDRSVSIGTGSLTVAGDATVLGNTFRVGGSTFVISGGKLGVGTASPESDVEFSFSDPTFLVTSTGTGTGQPRIRAGNSGNNFVQMTITKVGIAEFTTSSSTQSIRIGSGGNATIVTTGTLVGIGTTSPITTLDVGGQLAHFSRTTAQLNALAPDRAGCSVYNSTLNDMCFSTGTGVGAWVKFNDSVTACR